MSRCVSQMSFLLCPYKSFSQCKNKLCHFRPIGKKIVIKSINLTLLNKGNNRSPCVPSVGLKEMIGVGGYSVQGSAGYPAKIFEGQAT